VDGGSAEPTDSAADHASGDSGAPIVDAAHPTPDTGREDAGSAGDGFPDPSTFLCNLFIGVSVTGDWFTAGFEDGLNGDRWEAKTQSLAFVEKWANPTDAVWSQAVVSACPGRASSPDRVIFTGVNWTFTTESEWEDQLTNVIETLKSKFASLREIDLMTMLRAPGNQVCGNPGSPEQVVQPFIDAAVAAVAAKYPGFVREAPPFYAPSCDVFLPNSPHFADGGAAAVAKVMRDYYESH